MAIQTVESLKRYNKISLLWWLLLISSKKNIITRNERTIFKSVKNHVFKNLIFSKNFVQD